MSGNRSVRRRQERERARHKPTIVVGDGMLAAALNQVEAAPTSFAALPVKVAGQHRWLAIASYVLAEWSDPLLEREDVHKVLGPRNMHSLTVGCWDCEQPWSEAKDTPCTAGGSE